MSESDNNTLKKNTDSPIKQPVFWQLAFLLLVLIVIFSSAIVSQLSNVANGSIAENNLNQAGNVFSATAAATAKKIKINPFDSVDVLAKGAIVWDVANQKILYAKNEDKALPLASVTKLMTSLLTYELLGDKGSVKIDPTDIAQFGDSGLLAGESFPIDKLNDFVLMMSSNDGAHALANTSGAVLNSENSTQAFVEAMNIRAQQLKLNGLNFLNPTGLDISPTQSGAFGSAKDIAKLMSYILNNNPNLLKATTQTKDLFYNTAGAYHEAKNTNSIVNQIEGIIGSKTGYTDLAGGNLVIAFEAGVNRPIVVVVLGSTRNGRFQDVLELTSATRKYLSNF